MSGMPEDAIDVAIDNDIILKAASYRLSAIFWPGAGATCRIGVLGAAQYILPRAIDRADRVRNKEAAKSDLGALLASATVLEPTHSELSFAGEIEASAQQAGLALDAGESQLCSIVAARGILTVQTGDKRAVRSLEQLVDAISALSPVRGRVQCLEQIVLALLVEADSVETLSDRVCGEPDVDKTLSICFGCYSRTPAGYAAVVECLESYIAALRADAPRMIAA